MKLKNGGVLNMALKDTIKHLRDLLGHITTDLDKAEGGNKAASQRVRTGTVKLEKIAKVYRKESIKTEKGQKGSKKSEKKHAAAKPKAKAKAPAKAASHAKHAAPKAKAGKAVAKARPLALKRPTAKLPHRRAGLR
jgi:hypothetical protein